MADEFIARIPDRQHFSLVEVGEALSACGLCDIESMQNEEVLLRWTGQTRRCEWPEDIRLSRNDEEIVLSIHAGTNTQRSALIKQLESVLSRLVGAKVKFGDA